MTPGADENYATALNEARTLGGASLDRLVGLLNARRELIKERCVGNGITDSQRNAHAGAARDLQELINDLQSKPRE